MSNTMAKTLKDKSVSEFTRLRLNAQNAMRFTRDSYDH